MKVLMLSRYCAHGASSRLRMWQYLPRLKADGFEVDAEGLFGAAYLQTLYESGKRSALAVAQDYLRRLKVVVGARKYDLLWIEKELFPFIPAVGENLLSALGIPFVVDFDDAVFHSYNLSASALIRSTLGQKIESVMRSSALVIAGNSYLAEHAIACGARAVATIPTSVDLARYPVKAGSSAPTFVVGWMGSPSTAKYLATIEAALLASMSQENSVTRLIGAGASPFRSLPAEILPWSLEEEAAEIARFDVGIMPLVDGPWERGKCGYKLIQYMACGLPVIASPVGVNREIVRHGENGFLASSAAEWKEALETLRSDRGLREKMGAKGRATVAAGYCIEVAYPKLAELLRTAAGKGAGRPARQALEL